MNLFKNESLKLGGECGTGLSGEKLCQSQGLRLGKSRPFLGVIETHDRIGVVERSPSKTLGLRDLLKITMPKV
jgi:hypothetical protein